MISALGNSSGGNSITFCECNKMCVNAHTDDSVNDMDLPNKFKVTLTGPNAIGNKNPRNVSAKQKSLDPSHIGILSLDVCGSSNPGMSNYFNFLCETDGIQFKGRPPEPETFGLDWYRIRLQDEGFDPDGNQVFGLKFSDPVKFNNIMDVYDDISVHARS